QAFDGNREAGALGARNDLLGDAVVDALAEASLLSAEFLQSPLGGLSASALQSSTTAGEALADTLDLSSGLGPAFAVEREVDDAEVDPENALNVDLLGVWNIADASEIPPAPDQHQVDLALAVGEHR